MFLKVLVLVQYPSKVFICDYVSPFTFNENISIRGLYHSFCLDLTLTLMEHLLHT